MALYETLPGDFSDEHIACIKTCHVEISRTGSATHYEMMDKETGAAFFVIQGHPRMRDQSDYFRIVQLSGEQRMFSPVTIETRGYSKDPSHLAQRAILTAMREFELTVNRLH